MAASFGEKLRQQREIRGVSLREIAEGTKISVRFLQALEEDRVEVLPGGLFPRAFVRQYASFLGLDAERLSAEFLAEHTAPPLERKPAPPVVSLPRLSVTPGQLFLGVVAVAAVAFLLHRSSSDGRRTARVEPSPAPVPAAPAVLPSDRVLPPATVLPQTSAAPARERLVVSITAEEECWVEARADGTTVLNRVLAGGESQTLRAHGRIVLSVGNAGALRLRLNDRPALPLGHSGEVKKNIVITPESVPSLVDQERVAADGRSG
ncbi:MAG TPA: RodZ domain-containing protein [Vicinamibacteria bacterium]|nr:RodZ domain-containing protein [Vicinamibacteria bacterium]